jgi:hypothetical protein
MLLARNIHTFINYSYLYTKCSLFLHQKQTDEKHCSDLPGFACIVLYILH